MYGVVACRFRPHHPHLVTLSLTNKTRLQRWQHTIPWKLLSRRLHLVGLRSPALPTPLRSPLSNLFLDLYPPSTMHLQIPAALHKIPRKRQTLHHRHSATTKVPSGEEYNIDDWIVWDKIYDNGDAANQDTLLNLPSSPANFQTEVLGPPLGSDEPVVIESGSIEWRPEAAALRAEEIEKTTPTQPSILSFSWDPPGTQHYALHDNIFDFNPMADGDTTKPPLDTWRLSAAVELGRSKDCSNEKSLSPTIGAEDASESPHEPGYGPDLSTATMEQEFDLHGRNRLIKKKKIMKGSIRNTASPKPSDLEAQLKSRKRKPTQKSSDKSCKRRSQFPLASVAVLDDWFHSHRDSPYPTPGELDRLVEQSGLARKQVSTWLNNARSRKLQKDPMDAYVSSSSDNEAASIEDIRRAAESMPMPGQRHSFSSRQNMTYAKSASGSSAGSAFDRCPEARWSGPPRRGRRRYGNHASYASSRASSGASASSVGSASGVASVFKSFSLNSPSQAVLSNFPISSNRPTDTQYLCWYCSASFDSHLDLVEHKSINHWIPCQNMSRSISSEDMPDKSSSNPAKQLDLRFQCTFCKIHISEKSWKRHEETHIPQREWICMPSGHSGAEDPKDSFLVKCVFCNKQYGGCLSSEGCHRRQECLARPISDRTFHRKDKLVQHLKRFHNAKAKDFVLQAWEVRATDRPWDCGFCGMTVPNWETRTKHIRKHFREGLDMSSWKSPEAWRSIEEGKDNVARRNQETESLELPDGEVDKSETEGRWRKLFNRHSM